MADGPGNSTPDSATELTKAVTNAAVKAIGALATTAGFVTFVAVTGQAITWVRFRAAELPADQAVQLVPKDDLVIVGGLALGIFAVLGVISVTSVYAIDHFGRACDEMRPGLCVLITGEILIAIQFAAGGHKLWMSLFAVTVGLAAVAITALPVFYSDPAREDDTVVDAAEAAQSPSPPTTPASSATRADQRGQPGEQLAIWLRRQATRASRKLWTIRQVSPAKPITTAQQGQAEAGEPDSAPDEGVTEGVTSGIHPPATSVSADELVDHGPRHKLTWAGVGSVGLIAVLLLLAFALPWLFDELLVASMSSLAIALAAVCFGVARASGDNFWPYAFAVFFSVVLFGAALNAARLWDVPKASPVALLRAGNGGTSGVVGLLVAKADDRYWLGAVTLGCDDDKRDEYADRATGGSGRIFSVPRSQVLDDEIGAAKRLKHAQRQAEVLFRELKRRQPVGGSPPPGEKNLEGTIPKEARGAQTGQAAGMKVTAPTTAAVQLPLKPRIESLDPPSPMAKDPVTITGENLDGVQSVQVEGEDEEEPTSVSDTDVTFRAPVALAGKRVRVKSCRTGRWFTVDGGAEPPPGGDEEPEQPQQPTAHRQLGDEYFEVEGYELSPTGKRRLRKLRRELDRVAGKVQEVRIDGYADFTGRPAFNEWLSDQRATAVEDFLVRGRLTEGDIKAVGHGEKKVHTRELGSPKRELDRRVDVEVEYE